MFSKLSSTEQRIEIAAFFSAPNFEDDPFDDSDYVTSFNEFASLLAGKGGRLSIVRGQETYRGANTFSGGWVYDGKIFKRSEDLLEFHVIFNRKNFIGDARAVVVNTVALDDLCTNKSKSYDHFSSLFPKTVTMKQASEIPRMASVLGTTWIVGKPLAQEGGEGVIIGPREEVCANIREFPYLLQEFIDTSKGIPGITDGYHDLRIVSVRGTITHSYVRIPPKGKLVANVGQGGSMHWFKLEQIPQPALAIFHTVDQALKEFPDRIYSVDMGRNIDGQWKIIELNSKPGLLPLYYHPSLRTYHEKVAQVLLEVGMSHR